MARRRLPSTKKMRSLLRRARDAGSTAKAIGSLLAAMREADAIRFCGDDYTEEETREAFQASELIAQEMTDWSRELGVKKSELNDLIDGLLDDD